MLRWCCFVLLFCCFVVAVVLLLCYCVIVLSYCLVDMPLSFHATIIRVIVPLRRHAVMLSCCHVVVSWSRVVDVCCCCVGWYCVASLYQYCHMMLLLYFCIVVMFCCFVGVLVHATGIAIFVSYGAIAPRCHCGTVVQWYHNSTTRPLPRLWVGIKGFT